MCENVLNMERNKGERGENDALLSALPYSTVRLLVPYL